jgi:zinc protease
MLLCTAASDVHAAQTYTERTYETTLANGLKVILLEDHKAPVTTFQVWYRVGSRNETLGRTGLSHLLEHLMFKGTPKHGPEEYSRIIQRNGGNENAFTSDDNTTYFATLASDRLAVAVELEADRMHNLAFAPEEFVPEHKVVMEERRLRTGNNPVSALFEQVNATAFTAHPYQWPTVGWMNDLRLATREDALEYYRTHYTPGNAYVIVVGDFDREALLRTIDKEFGAVPAGSPAPTVRAIEPPQGGERRTVLRREAQLPFVAIAYHVPNLRSDDAFALEVLATVLAGGKSARLHNDLVYEKRLARSVGASYSMTSADPGLFYVYGQPLPGKSVSRLEEELLAHVARLQSDVITERDLNKAKNGLEAGFIFAQDSLFYQGMLLGQYEMSGRWQNIDRYVPGIRAVTVEDLRRVASFYLTPENRTVGVLEPLPPSTASVPALAAHGGAH